MTGPVGFSHSTLYANNADFSNSGLSEEASGLQTDKQIWVGTTALNAGGTHINVLTLTEGAGVSITQAATTLTIGLAGGGAGIDTIIPQTGVNVVPDGGGNVTINGAVVAAGTNPVRTDGTGANTLAIEVQTSQALAAADATKIGLSNFDSAAFDVSATGFVQLNGGGIAATAFDVQANTAPGTDPVVPTAAGVVVVNGAAVANHSVVLETRSRAANAYNLEVQYAAAAAATDATKSGVAHFSSTNFSVDANGFVTSLGAMNDYHVARYIVSAGGATDGANYTTITAAYAAAVAAGAPQVVFIQPGTYTENLTLTSGIHLAALNDSFNNASPTIINGSLTLTSGTVSCDNISFATNATNIAIVSGSALINFYRCGFFSTNAVPFTCNSGNLNFFECNLSDTNTGQIFSCTNTSTIRVTNCMFLGSGSTASTLTNTSGITFRNSTFQTSISCALTSTFLAYNSQFGETANNFTLLTTSGTTSTHKAYNCAFLSGNATAISVGSGTTVKLSNCVVETGNSTAIGGSGTINLSAIEYTSTSSLVNTTTQTVQVTNKGAYKVSLPAGDYTVLATDEIVGATSSAARAITLNASPSTGQVVTIKDVTGTAAANNITITPAAGTIDGAATKIINTNYGSVTLYYSGANWFII